MRVAVSSAVVLTSLVLAGSALAVTVSSFTPNSGLPQTPAGDGSACAGAPVQINGSGFVSDGPTVVGDSTTTVSVSFNGAKSPWVQVGSNTTLYTIVPNGATDGPITVTTAAGSATSTATFHVNPCTYTPVAVACGAGYANSTPGQVPGGIDLGDYLQVNCSAVGPGIMHVSPSKGTVGTTVWISGSNFFRVKSVKVGGVPAKFKVVSHVWMSLTVPTGAKSGKITVTTANGTGTSKSKFVVK
jgi:hypothetical protein